MIDRILLLIFCLISIYSFSQTEEVEKKLNSNFYNDQFVGFYLYDLSENKELINYNGEKYFLPASNTKIATLYTVMKVLKDSIPGMFFYETPTELHFQGTGDPTFLHPKFNNNRILNFLKNSNKTLVFHATDFEDEAFANGWSWDDYSTDYTAERSSFPIYGNLVEIKKNGNQIVTKPFLFKDNVQILKKNFVRENHSNQFYLASNKSTEKIPFITDVNTVKNILEEVVGKSIVIDTKSINPSAKIMYSTSWQEVAKTMMEESDNFLAEQLLISCSSLFSKKIGGSKMIDIVLNNQLSNLSQKPVWNDGSGLSRYNLFSPKSLVQILEKLYREFPDEQVLDFLAVGGKTGTIKNRYKSKEPFVFAKTGAVSNNVTLSGYIKTKSGKMLSFSLMNNHTTKNLTQVRNKNEELINYIRDNY